MPKTQKADQPVEDVEQSEQAEAIPTEKPDSFEPNVEKKENDAAAKARERQQRFKALQARAVCP